MTNHRQSDRVLRVGCGAGFLGDNLDAPRRLVQTAELDYLTLEYLAELTLSILARKRQKDPQAGYADDFLTVLGNLAGDLQAQRQLKIVTNGGGMNPLACARAAAKLLDQRGCGNLAIGVVTGDDLMPHMDELRAAGCTFENLDTGEPLASLAAPLVSANAYLGAQPIAKVLAAGARIVITGRVADASLTLGPAAHEFGWNWQDWNRLAGGSVAGHLIECAAQVTGGYSSLWLDHDLAAVGYPIAEVATDGSCVITKPTGSGGVVNRQSVGLQLMYEIGDPRHYLTPDVDVDFTTVSLHDDGPDRVRATGATGNPATDTYKASLAYHDGYASAGQLLVYGRDCVPKAREAARVIGARLDAAGLAPRQFHVELLGAGDGVPGLHTQGVEDSRNIREVMLRVSVRDPRREAVERFTKEIAPLITSGPDGLAGYASGRPDVRPVFAYWPALVPKSAVVPRTEVRTAREWLV